MAELGQVLAVVLAVNVLLWLGQVAVLELNPEGPSYYNCKDSMIGSLEASNCQGAAYVVDDANPANLLPSEGGEIEVDSGNVFTDTFSAALKWLTDGLGLKYVYNILAAPANFLKALGLPSEFSFAIGVMWYGFTLFILVSYILGRDY